MAESKKYWYIQLNVNFFEDDRIDWLSEQQNGYAYVVLYLKLCLKTANNNGILTRQIGDIIIPYDVKKIAEVTKMDVDTVRVALELYKRIGLIYESNEDRSFMQLKEVPKMVGYTTQYAIDKAKYREKQKTPQLESAKESESDNVQDNVQDNVRQEKELRVKSLELRDKSSDTELKEERKGTAKAVMPTREELLERFGKVADVLTDWLNYKQERKEGYKPTGLKSLLTQVENQIKQHGEQPVIDVINMSMSNGWRGIIWDRIPNDKKGYYDPNLYNSTGGYASL